MLRNVRVLEIMSQHTWIDSRKEANKLNYHSNGDDDKKRMSTCVSSAMDSFNNKSQMSRTDLDKGN